MNRNFHFKIFILKDSYISINKNLDKTKPQLPAPFRPFQHFQGLAGSPEQFHIREFIPPPGRGCIFSYLLVGFGVFCFFFFGCVGFGLVWIFKYIVNINHKWPCYPCSTRTISVICPIFRANQWFLLGLLSVCGLPPQWCYKKVMMLTII